MPPRIMRAPNERELEALRKLFLQAETDIINEIARLRTAGLMDYHAVAALERIQAILRRLEDGAWRYVPRMVEKQFYVNAPEAARELESIAKHVVGYGNAATLTAAQSNVAQLLINNLMGEIVEAEMTVMENLQSALLGGIEPDIYRRVGLETVAGMQARGASVASTVPQFVETLQREGVTAFTDKAGRNWSLHTYGNMICRTASRQAEITAVLTADPEQDLYKISSHESTCAVCAPLEGRVYSRSGRDKDFPPLARAFGKIDPAGADTLENTWLNIHPNCLHVLMPWTPVGKSDAEIQRIKDFSSFEKNPPTNDPRTQAQIEAYRQKERNRARWLNDYQQWERYRVTLGDKVPKTFNTFLRHKRAGDDKYKNWLAEYRAAGRSEGE